MVQFRGKIFKESIWRFERLKSRRNEDATWVIWSKVYTTLHRKPTRNFNVTHMMDHFWGRILHLDVMNACEMAVFKAIWYLSYFYTHLYHQYLGGDFRLAHCFSIKIVSNSVVSSLCFPFIDENPENISRSCTDF